MKDKKKSIIMSVIIGVLLIAVIVLSVLLVSNRKSDETADTTEAVSETVEDTSTEEETETEEESDLPTSDIYAEITVDNSWENGSKMAATESVIIYNDSSETVTDWSIYITFSCEPSIDSIWNGISEIDGNTVIVTAESYNTEIAAGGNISFGYNITADDINYESYKIFSGDEQIGGSDYEQTEITTEEVTEEEEESNVVNTDDGDSPYASHGSLTVTSSGIVDENGNAYQLKGVSTHGITWFPDYINKDTFEYLKENWGANAVRLAMYTDTGDSYGYCSGGDKDEIEALVDTGVTAATELGMYVIIDWHILNDGDPNTHIDEAKEFFEKMSEKYADYGNVIFEICNEPNGGTTWSQVKSYAEEIIPIIRANSDAVIIVGCPTWCQDIDQVAADPIENQENIIYSVHFYAASHKEDLRNKVQAALDSGLPVIISEFGLCDASGAGSIDYDQSDAWFDLIEDENLSYFCWSLSNKDETASLISSSCQKITDFTDDDLSDSGKYLKEKMN